MAKQSLSNIKNWFKTGLIPTQAQFWDTWDSFWHKDDLIPAASIEGLDALLDSKAENADFQAHLIDENAHSELFVKTKIYQDGEFQIFKVLPNVANELEDGDYVVAIVEGVLIQGKYEGGNPLALTSYPNSNQL
jgi:hypothetical protein